MNRFIQVFFAFSLAFFLVGVTRFFFPGWFEGGLLDFNKKPAAENIQTPETDAVDSQNTNDTENTMSAEEQLLAQTPESEAKLFERAQKFFSHGALTLAENDLNILLEKNPNHREGYLMLIKLHIRTRNFVAAEKVARSGLAGPFANDNEFTIMLGDLFLQQGKVIDARNTFSTLPEGSAERNFFLGLIEIVSGNHQSAEQLLENAKTSNMFQQRSNILLAAYKEFSLFPDGNGLHRDTLLAKALNDIEQYELSLILSKQVLSTNAGYRDAWLVNGYSYLGIGRYEFAQNAFQKAFEIDPANPNTTYFLGLTYKKLGDYERALTYFDRSDKNGFPEEKELLLEMADAQYLNGNYDLAFETYEKMLELYGGRESDFVRPMYIALDVLKKPELGIAMGNWVVELYPESALAYNLRGWAYTEGNNLDKAEADLNKALELDRNMVAAYLNLGILREKQGRMEEALDLYEAVYELEPLSEIGGKAVQRYNALVQ